MLKAKSAGILRPLPPLHRLYAARPDRRRSALGALLLVTLLTAGLAAAGLLLGPAGPVQAEDSRPPAPTAPPAQQQPAVSSDATLSGLALLDWHSREVPLRPAFSAQTAEYGGTLPLLSTGLVRLRPTANHSGATITVDGKAVASGAKSDYFSLEINTPQRIVVAVTAEDGVTRREYAVTVTKDPRAELSALSVSDVKLHPFVFSGRNTEYRGWVGHEVTEVKVTPTNRYDKGTITVNGHTVASGQASPAIALAEGENEITATITAPDNYTSRTYTLTITRATAAASADATLRGLAVYTATSSQPDAGNEVPYAGTAYPLSPALASGVYEYRVVVPEEVARRARESEESGYVYVTAVATTTAPGAKSIVVQGQGSVEEARHPKREVVTGESSGPWYAFVGYSPISIEVTSLDGKNVQTYLVVVEHGGDLDDPRGVAVTPGDGQLTLSWGENTGDAAPRLYWARWREAGTTTWLNEATLAGWKTGYGDGAPEATAADGQRVTGNSYTITGLTNGTEYEVELRGTRAGATSYRVTNWLQSRWVTVQGTPGQAATTRTLTITPSAPSREYGGTDDLSYAVGGLVDGDAATDVVTGTLSRAAGNDAGSYAISMGTLSIATAYAGKYALPASPSIASYTITPRAITAVSGVTVNSRPADGSVAATFDTSAANGTGVLTAELGDFRSGGLQVSGSFPAATPGTHDVSVTYSLADQGSFKAANYTLSAAADTLQGQLTQVPVCAPGLALATHGTAAEGGDPVVVIVAVSQPAGPDGVEVTLTTGGTATYGDDYALSPATVSIAASESIGTAVVTVVDDAIDDDDETVILNAAVAAASLTAAPATLTIADNDDASKPVVNTGCTTPANGDYDSDDDGLIEVCSLEQLNAIHWDPDGDGLPDVRHDRAYAATFPNAASGMGCPQTGCNGYELTADLDFDTNGNGRGDAGDKFSSSIGFLRVGWLGIGKNSHKGEFSAVFDGNGHVIRNLFINCCNNNGLFGRTSARAVIRNVGVEDVLLNSDDDKGHVGGLVGHNGGTIINSYTTGAVSGYNGVGGLVGGSDDTSMIIGSYSTATVTGSADDVGGLVGGNEGAIVASYATGKVIGAGYANGNYVPGVSDGRGHAIGGLVGLNYRNQKIIASYATGAVSAPNGEKVGGLVGYNWGGHITASYATGAVSGRKEVSGLAYSSTTWGGGATSLDAYWDTTTSGLTASSQGIGKTTAELQSPTGYAGIYAFWNVDLDGDGSADDPWDFGASCQYPLLKYGDLNPADQRSSCAPTPTVETTPDYAALIAQMYQWRNDPQWRHQKAHTDRWDRALLAFGEAVADSTLTAMTAAQAQALADQDWGERWVPVAQALREIEANRQRQQQQQANQAPTVANAIGDVTIVNQSGTRQVFLGRVFNDFDDDALTVTASSSDEAVATVSVAADYSALTVSARARGTVTITVTANDGNGGTVSDSFTVTVKAAPAVASAIADLSSLAAGATQDVSLSGVFSDADGDALTITASSSDETKATVTVASDGSKVTLTGVAEGTATITVTAQDADGNRVSDAFQVEVSAGGQYAALITQMYQWRNDPQWRHQKSHTDRWDRALLAFGETVSDTTLTAMTAAEAQGLADSGLTRWVEVARALREIEGSGQQTTPNRAPTVSAAIADATIVNESGSRQVSLSGVFDDADGDSLTISAASSDEAKATVSVASDGSSLTVSAQARGTAVITVTASDGNGGTVSDSFTVTVKAAPVVASALADVSGLETGDTQDVSLSGVFTDADGDALTITAASSDETKATVSVASDGSKLTLAGVAEGTTTITVTAQDSDGNAVSDAFQVEVAAAEAQDEGAPSPVTNLSCDAQTDRVTFRWDAPQWSGVEVYAYDYVLGRPDGKWKLVRLQGYPVVNEPGEYQAGTKASISIKAVYENPDGSEVSSAAVSLTCTVAE